MSQYKTPRFLAPLFDRLIDENPSVPHEYPPFITYDTDELFMSIAAEVSRLLNTRSFYARWQEGETPDEIRWSVLGYGYFDFSSVTGASGESWDKLAEMMAETVMRFEPRFLNVHVEVDHYSQSTWHLTLNIYGDVLVDAVAHRIQFPVTMDSLEIGGDFQSQPMAAGSSPSRVQLAPKDFSAR